MEEIKSILKLKLAKSGIISEKGVPSKLKHIASEVLNINLWNALGQYLGIPSEWGRSKSYSFTWVKEKVFKKLEGGNENLLSHAGKVT